MGEKLDEAEIVEIDSDGDLPVEDVEDEDDDNDADEEDEDDQIEEKESSIIASKYTLSVIYTRAVELIQNIFYLSKIPVQRLNVRPARNAVSTMRTNLNAFAFRNARAISLLKTRKIF